MLKNLFIKPIKKKNKILAHFFIFLLVFDIENKKKYEKKVLKKSQRICLIHRVYLMQLQGLRKYRASTKTRSEVRGGGRKPWCQKGTGRARAGSNRSPLWVGGGVSFGPRPHRSSKSKKINKKERHLALFSILYFKQKQFLILDKKFNFEEITNSKYVTKIRFVLAYLWNLITKRMQKKYSTLLDLIGAHKVLFIISYVNKELWFATRNLKNFNLSIVSSLNIKQLMNTSLILFSPLALKLIDIRYE